MAAGDGAPSPAPAAAAPDAAAAATAPPVPPSAFAGGVDDEAANAGDKAAALADLEVAAGVVPITVLFPAEGTVYTAATDPTQPVRQLLHAVPHANTELAPAGDGAAGGHPDGAASAAADGVPPTEVRSFIFRRMVVTQSQLDEYMRTLTAIRNPQRPAWLSMLLARQTGGRARDKPYVPPADARWRLFHNGRRLRIGRTVAESNLQPGGAVLMLGAMEGRVRR